MGFSGQEYWSVLPFPSPEGIPDPVIKAVSPELAGGFFTTKPSGKPVKALERLKKKKKALYKYKVWMVIIY